MALRTHTAQGPVCQDEMYTSNVELQRLPSYQTGRSESATTLPKYESLEWVDDLALLEAAQVAQKNPAARAKYDAPAVEAPAPAVTVNLTAPADLAPQATGRDVERGTVQSTANARVAISNQYIIIVSLLITLVVVQIFVVDLFNLPGTYPEDWSMFYLNYMSVWKRYDIIHAGVTALCMVLSGLFGILQIGCRNSSLPLPHPTHAALFCFCLTVLLIFSRLILSGNGSFFLGYTHEEAVAYFYEVLKFECVLRDDVKEHCWMFRTS